MTNNDLNKDPTTCTCINWPRDPRIGGHHPECPMHPDNLIRDAAKAMLGWGAEEDGVLPEAWPVYQRLVLAVTGTMPHCCNRCDAALPKGEGPGTCAGCVAAMAEREGRRAAQEGGR
jgi:hypothetical protein